MATTKAFELAQLSALTAVDASGNVTASTNTIANASGDLTFDSVAGDIVLDAHGNQVIFKGSGGQVGFIDLATGRMDIKSSTADQQMRFQGNDGGVPINAVVLDMANGGRATFNENVVVGDTLSMQAGSSAGKFAVMSTSVHASYDFYNNGTSYFNDQVNIDAVLHISDTTTSTSSATGSLQVLGGAGIAENLNVGGNLVVTGDFTVEGTSVTLNTAALDVEDKNITLNYHATGDTSASADGAGITIQDAVNSTTNASILWDAGSDKFVVSHTIDVTGDVLANGLTVDGTANINGSTNINGNFGGFLKFTRTDTTSVNNNDIGAINFAHQDTDDAGTAATILASGDGTAGEVRLSVLTGTPTDRLERLRIKSSGDISFYENNGGTPQVGMHWDYADGQLGVGTTSPTSTVDIRGPNGAPQSRGQLYLTNTDTAAIDNGSQISLGGTYSGTSDTYFAAIAGRKENSTVGDYHGYLQLSTRQTSGNIERMRITSDGRVGLGTTSPDASLEISNNLNVDAVYTGSISGTTLTVTAITSGVIEVGHRISDASLESNTKIIALGTGTGGIGTYTVNVSQTAVSQTLRSVPSYKNVIRFTDKDTSMAGGTHLGMLEFYSSDSGNEGVKGFIGTTTETAAAAGQLIFGTGTNGAVDATTKMVITSVGNVGIGTDSTGNRKLKVHGTSGDISTEISTDATSNAFLRFSTDLDGTHRSGIIGIDYSDNIFKMNHGGSFDGVLNGLAIKSTGYVGIGTTNPAQNFVVAEATNGKGVEIVPGSLAYIQAYDRGTSGYSNLKIDALNITFGTDNGSNRMSIKSDGKVGIGDFSSINPSHKLDVDGAIATRQVRHSVRPTLSLDFANSKQLDPLITFYRNSIATYFGNDGTLKYASHNTPRFDHDPITGESKGLLLEETRSNIFLYSNPIADLDFSGGWVNNTANKIQVTINAGEAPDGTYTATRISNLINSQTDPDVYLYQSHNLNGGETITYSIWIKSPNTANIGKHIEYRGKRIGGSGSGWGQVGTLTADWQRISVSNTYNADNTNIGRAYIGARTNYGNFTDDDGNTVAFDAASEFLVWGAVAEEGAFMTSYIPTNLTSISRSTSATYQDKDGVLRTAFKNDPRFGYKWDGRKYVPTGLIVESSATNLAAETESFGGAWYTTSYTKSDALTVLPNGASGSAVKLIMSNGQSANSPTALGVYMGAMQRYQNQIYNSSFFAKMPASNIENGVRIRDGLRTGAFLDINLNNGEVTNGSTSTFMDVIVEKYAHGWWRISYNYEYTGASGVGSWHAIRSYNDGDGSKGWLIWGAQITSTAHSSYFGLSSYVPNPTGVANAVTRSADVPDGAVATREREVAKINNINYSDWYNTKEGTIYTDFHPTHSADDVVIGVGDGTSRGFRAPWLSGATQMRLGTWSGTIYSALHYYSSIVPTDPHKSALSFSYLDNTFLSSLDGSTTAVTSPWPGVETDATTIWIGGETDTARKYSGHIRKVSIYNEALSTAELQALTENN